MPSTKFPNGFVSLPQTTQPARHCPVLPVEVKNYLCYSDCRQCPSCCFPQKKVGNLSCGFRFFFYFFLPKYKLNCKLWHMISWNFRNNCLLAFPFITLGQKLIKRHAMPYCSTVAFSGIFHLENSFHPVSFHFISLHCIYWHSSSWGKKQAATMPKNMHSSQRKTEEREGEVREGWKEVVRGYTSSIIGDYQGEMN